MTDSQGAMRPGGIFSIAGREVSRVGYGAMQLPSMQDSEAARAVVRRAHELGVNHFDTAHFYGDGIANRYLAEVVGGQDDVLLITKLGARAVKGGPMPLAAAQRPEELRQEVYDNLVSLGAERLEVAYLRRIAPGSFPLPPEQEVDFDDQLAEMVALRDEGLVGSIGLSTVSIDELQAALPAGIAVVQNQYSLLSREDEAVRHVCRDGNIGWAPYFPLGGNHGSAKVTDHPTVQEIAHDIGASAAQVGLSWLLHRSENALTIAGTTSIEHLEQNVAAGSISLDAAVLERLDSATV